MRKIAFLLVLLLAVGLAITGCRRRAVRGQVVTGDGDTTGMEVGGGVFAHGTPREQLEQYDQVLRQAGFEPVGPVSHGTLDAYSITAIPVDIRRGYCYTLSAIGQPGTDLNLLVLDPRGQDIAHNVLGDEHPWVSFCAARGGRFVIRLQMARGSGEYFFAPYQSRGRRAADLTAFFGGGAAAPTGPATATLDADTQGRIAALDAQLAGERY